MRHLRWLAGSAMAVSALLAAGCGGSTGSPGSGSSPASSAPASPASAAALAARVRSAVSSATSYHVAGVAADAGKTARIDLSLTRTGEAAGTIALGAGTIGLLTTHGKTYIKITSAFLKDIGQPASACALFCDKYLVTSGAQAKSIGASLGFSSITGNAFTSSLAGAKLAGSGTVSGQPAWIMRLHDGSSLYVAAQGPAYPLRATPPAGKGQGQLDFSQWNSATIPPPPPASQVVDISKLGG